MKITKRQLRKIIKEFNIPNPVQIDDDEELLFQVAVKIKDIMPPDDALGMADEDFRSMVVGIYDDYFDPIGEGWEPYPADLEAIKGHLTIIPEPGDLDYEYPVQERKGDNMKITKRQLRRIIKEEKTKVLQEYGAMSKESLNPTIAFAQAWSGLGDAIQEQMIDLVNAHVEGRLEDAIYEINPNAFERAQERLTIPLRMMDGEDADELQDMMEQVSQAIRDME